MVDKLEKGKNQNYVELTEKEIFEKIKKDLSPIQENLSKKKITINEARSELKRINEWVQGSKLENKDKENIGEAFEKIVKLEENIDVNTFEHEVKEIEKLLNFTTRNDLMNLKKDINRPIEVQQGIKNSSKRLDLTINEASEDENKIASWVGNLMKWLNS